MNYKKSSDIEKICDHPGCKLKGEYRAPKDRCLKEYYWFCLKHVTEYNKSWNFYEGMNIEEIELQNKLDSIWHAPTWKFGISLDKLQKQGKLKDPFEIYNTYIKNQKINNVRYNNERVCKLNKNELDALKFFKLTFPYTEQDLKNKYKSLVKLYHPDVNSGSKEHEEIFKKTVEYYNLLLKKIKDN